MPNSPVRIGLWLQSLVLERYQAAILDAIRAETFGVVVAVRQYAIGRRIARRQTGLLFEWYRRRDAASAAGPKDPRAPVDCRAALGPSLCDEAAFAASDLDVVLNFAGVAPGDGASAPARFGVWTIRPGDPDQPRRDPAFFWELPTHRPVTGVGLEARVGSPAQTRILSVGFYETNRISLAANTCHPLWGASTIVVQKLRELGERGWASLVASSRPAAAAPHVPAATSGPSSMTMARWLPPILVRRATRRWRQPRPRHWRLATRVGSPRPLVGSGAAPDLRGFRVHESPRGHFYADPFLIEADGSTWVFFEDFDYACRKGAIACAEIRGDGSLGPVRSVLERPYHLSYPCLARANGDVFMVPESANAGTIDLYRCARFPDQWMHEKTLMRVGAFDTTLFRHGDYHWLLTSTFEPRVRARQLQLFFARDLLGEWTPHPANPLSNDVRDNRSAGAVVAHEGQLFRLSQDCGRDYGYSFTFHAIDRLDTTTYAEHVATTVTPTWAADLVGTHTYARCGAIEVIDLAVRRPARVVGAPPRRPRG